MKINDTIKTTPGLPATNTPAAGGESAERTASANPAQADNVRLSPGGQAMANAVGGSASVRHQSRAHQGGRSPMAISQVNSEKVADGLLETVRDLLHSRKR